MGKNLDAIIIGGGISGLTAGAYLAQKGVNVKLFERMKKAGGLVDTFSRKGYTFEGTTHQAVGFNKGGYLGPVLKKLNLSGLECHESNVIYTTKYIENDKIVDSYSLPTGRDNLVKALIKYFPEEIDNINEFMRIMESITKDVMRLGGVVRFINLLPKSFDALGALLLVKCKENSFLNRIGKKIYGHFIKYEGQTFDELLHFLPDKLKSLLSQYWMYLGELPNNVSGAMILVMLYNFCIDKPVLLKGGMKSLTEKLVFNFQSNGGQIYYNSNVNSVHVEKKKVQSVTLADGITHCADFIISAISTKTLFGKMIDDTKLPPIYLETIKNVELSQGSFQIYIGMPILLQDFGITTETTFFNYSYNLIYNGKPTTNTPFAITNYSMIDKTYSPEGHSSFVIHEIDDCKRWENLSLEQYEKQKTETENLILDKFEKVTGIIVRGKSNVLFSATPRTMKHYSGNTGGESFATACVVGQSFIKQTNYETPLSNLFLMGSYAYSAPGVGSVLDTTYSFTKQVLLKMRYLG